jgi:hypothetical protein
MLDQKTFSIQSIDIVSVKSSIPRSNFSSEEIDFLANNYLKCGGNISPIIVEVTGLDEYKVVEGHLEFYAAKRAKEIDNFFELIRAIILDNKNKQDVLEQFELSKITHSTHVSTTTNGNNIEDKIKNLEDTLYKSIDELSKKIESQSQTINKLFKKPSSLSYLEHFNNSSVVELTNILDRKGGLSNTKAKTIASLIIESRQHGEFESLFDLIERVRLKTGRKNKDGKMNKAISQETMLKIIDSWSQADSASI